MLIFIFSGLLCQFLGFFGNVMILVICLEITGKKKDF